VSKLLSRKVLAPAFIVIIALVILNLLPIPGVVVPEISIPAETVLHLFGFPITNTLLATWLVRNYLVRTVSRFIATNRYHWDDALLKNSLLEKLVWFVPVTLLYQAQDLLVPADSSAAEGGRMVSSKLAWATW